MTRAPFTVDRTAALAAHLAGRIARDLAARAARSWTIALSGGSVATTLLPHVARQPLPWEACDVVFADERRVGADDPESNWRVCRAAATGTPMTAARWHRLPADLPDVNEAVRRYAATLRAVAGSPPVLDVALLGVGEDGHVASLFPGHAHDAPDGVILERHAPKPPAVRVSLTMRVLAGARLTCVVALGAAKRPLIRQARAGLAGLPVTTLLESATAPWLLADLGAGRDGGGEPD